MTALRNKTFILYFLISLLVHSLFFKFVFQSPSERLKPLPKENIPLKVVIIKKPQEREKIAPVPKNSLASGPHSQAKARKENKGDKESSGGKIVASPAAEGAKDAVTNSSYGSLLPKAAEIDSTPSQESGPEPPFARHRWLRPYNSQEKRILLDGADSLAASFDVPLESRKKDGAGEAKAKIRFVQAKRLLLLEYLEGSPILRAVLYKNLLNERVQARLIEVMQVGLEGIIRIVLHVMPEEGFDDWKEGYRWADARLDIYKAIFVPPPPPPDPAPEPSFRSESLKGTVMSLAPPGVRKATGAELLELSDLKKLPAYDHPLHNFILCEGCVEK